MNISKTMTERRKRNLLITQIAAWLFVNGFPYALITRSPKAFGHIWAIVRGGRFILKSGLERQICAGNGGSGNWKPSLPPGGNSLFTPSQSL